METSMNERKGISWLSLYMYAYLIVGTIVLSNTSLGGEIPDEYKSNLTLFWGDKGSTLAEAYHLEVAGTAIEVEQFYEHLEIGLCVILVSGGIHHHGRAVVGIQQGLDVQAFQQGLGAGFVQLPVRINKEYGREVVGAAFGPGGAAVRDGNGRTLGEDDVGEFFTATRLGGGCCAKEKRQGKGYGLFHSAKGTLLFRIVRVLTKNCRDLTGKEKYLGNFASEKKFCYFCNKCIKVPRRKMSVAL